MFNVNDSLVGEVRTKRLPVKHLVCACDLATFQLSSVMTTGTSLANVPRSMSSVHDLVSVHINVQQVLVPVVASCQKYLALCCSFIFVILLDRPRPFMDRP